MGCPPSHMLSLQCDWRSSQRELGSMSPHLKSEQAGDHGCGNIMWILRVVLKRPCSSAWELRQSLVEPYIAMLWESQGISRGPGRGPGQQPPLTSLLTAAIHSHVCEGRTLQMIPALSCSWACLRLQILEQREGKCPYVLFVNCWPIDSISIKITVVLRH